MSRSSSPDAPGKTHRFGVLGAVLMAAAAVISLSMIAQESLAMWFYIGFATLFLLIPGVFVSAARLPVHIDSKEQRT